MPKLLTLKKPKFLGATAQAIGARATIGQQHKREATARQAIAKAFEGHVVHLLRNGRRLCVLVESEIPPNLGMIVEGRAKIEWAGNDGTIILRRIED